MASRVRHQLKKRVFLIPIFFIFHQSLLWLFLFFRNSINLLCKCAIYHLTKTYFRASYKNAVSKLHLVMKKQKTNVKPVHIKDSMEQTLTTKDCKGPQTNMPDSCLWLQSRSVLSSFGVVLMCCRVNFHVVRSALQYSVCRI